MIRDYIDEKYTKGTISKLYDDAKAYRPKTKEEYKWPHKWLFIFTSSYVDVDSFPGLAFIFGILVNDLML